MENESLSEAIRVYVRRKFGEFEHSKIVLTHEDLRYLLMQFTTEQINLKAEEQINVK